MPPEPIVNASPLIYQKELIILIFGFICNTSISGHLSLWITISLQKTRQEATVLSEVPFFKRKGMDSRCNCFMGILRLICMSRLFSWFSNEYARVMILSYPPWALPTFAPISLELWQYHIFCTWNFEANFNVLVVEMILVFKKCII